MAYPETINRDGRGARNSLGNRRIADRWGVPHATAAARILDRQAVRMRVRVHSPDDVHDGPGRRTMPTLLTRSLANLLPGLRCLAAAPELAENHRARRVAQHPFSMQTPGNVVAFLDPTAPMNEAPETVPQAVDMRSPGNGAGAGIHDRARHHPERAGRRPCDAIRHNGPSSLRAGIENTMHRTRHVACAYQGTPARSGGG